MQPETFTPPEKKWDIDVEYRGLVFRDGVLQQPEKKFFVRRPPAGQINGVPSYYLKGDGFTPSFEKANRFDTDAEAQEAKHQYWTRHPDVQTVISEEAV